MCAASPFTPPLATAQLPLPAAQSTWLVCFSARPTPTHPAHPNRPNPQARYAELMSDESYIDSVLAQGADAASLAANRTLADVRDAMGFVPPYRRPRGD